MEAKREEITFPKRLHQEASQWGTEIRATVPDGTGSESRALRSMPVERERQEAQGVAEGKDKGKHKETRPA